MEEIMVSIICNTYNQETYIEQAIMSFLAQKTNFQYEVIIHDDASTDGTTEIIRKYQRMYPGIIKPIYETVNQYSQGVKITANISLPKASGKYFALCEGDDYWIDPYKLQKQVDYMEKNPECTLCIHNAVRVDTDGRKIGHVATVKESRKVECPEVINGGGGFCVTNSILAPVALTKDLPAFILSCSLDYFWQIYFASMGATYCFEDEMSAYRVNAIGSWSRSMTKSNEAVIKHEERKIVHLKMFDEYTQYKYQSEVERSIVCCQYKIYAYRRDKKSLKKEPFASYGKSFSLKKKVKLYLWLHCPITLRLMKRIKECKLIKKMLVKV